MPIYNRNSVGDVSVVANESYGYADMGRILSECVANDMILFNTVIRNDFKENTAIREGTMVASEIQALREFSVKEAWGGLKEKLKKLWEKIKGVFKRVYAQLTVWLVRNGKSFVAIHRKTLANKTGLSDIKLPECYTPSSKYEGFIKSFEDLEKKAKAYMDTVSATSEVGDATTVDTTAIANKFLSSSIGDGVTVDNAWEKGKDIYFEPHKKGITFGDLHISYEELLNTISAGSKTLKDIRKANNAADKSIKEMIKALESKEKGETKDTEESKRKASAYAAASKCCSGYERAMTTTTKVAIKTVKFNIAQSRKIVGALVGGGVKENAELALMEAGEDIREMEEIEGTPEEVADAIEDAKEDGVEIEINVNDCGD